MADRQQSQQHEYELKKAFKQDLGYDYIEIEFLLQENKDLKEKSQAQQDDLKGYALGAKLSRNELRKDRKNRQKSWIEINHRMDEYSIAESRMLH